MSEQEAATQPQPYTFPLPDGFVLVPIQPPALLMMAELVGIPANTAAQMYSTIIKTLALQQPVVPVNGLALACPCGENLLAAIGYPEKGNALVRLSTAATVKVTCTCGLEHDLKENFTGAIGTANLVIVPSREDAKAEAAKRVEPAAPEPEPETEKPADGGKVVDIGTAKKPEDLKH